MREKSSMGSYNLERFVTAQKGTYEAALREIKNGHKESHWIWFIFPQMRGLGISRMSDYYGIGSLEEAKEYLRHPVLGPRLKEISEVLLKLSSDNADEIFGWPDNMKLRSSMTLFSEADAENRIFAGVLRKFFKGEKDERTLELIKC
jgi:uncharacterized protein (DUF1810 family)